MADPFALSVQYQDRLNNSTKALDDLPDRFMQGMKIPGIIAQNQLLKNEVKDSNAKLSANEQLRSMMSDPMGFGKQFGDLKSAKEMRQFIANHAAISITPLGEQVLQRFDRIASATEQAEVHSMERQLEAATNKKRGEFLAGAIDAGYDPNNPDDVKAYRAEQSQSQFRTEAFKMGKDVSGLINLEDIDAQGRFLPGVKDRILRDAPRSEVLQSRDEIADERLKSQEEIARVRAHAIEARALASGQTEFAPTNLKRHFEEAAAMGTPYSPEEQKTIRDRTLRGGKAKKEALTEEEYLDKQGEYVAKNIRAFMKGEPKGSDGKKPLTEDEGIAVLQGQFRKMFPKPVAGSDSSSGGGWELVTLPDGTSYRRRQK